MRTFGLVVPLTLTLLASAGTTFGQAGAPADPRVSAVQALIQEIEGLIRKIEDPMKRAAEDLTTLRIKQATLQEWIDDASAVKAMGGIDPALEPAMRATAKQAADTVRKDGKRKLDEVIGSSRPMTAVLFSDQDRNAYEVVADPNASDPSIGVINQSSKGSTAGILIAAEAPFVYPRIGGSRIPIGAWFGANVTSGTGDDLGVDLAAGFSFSLITEARIESIQNDGPLGWTGHAKLLLGVVYGKVRSLGASGPGTTLEVGDPYPLGATVPVTEDRRLNFTIGIGFRF